MRPKQGMVVRGGEGRWVACVWQGESRMRCCLHPCACHTPRLASQCPPLQLPPTPFSPLRPEPPTQPTIGMAPTRAVAAGLWVLLLAPEVLLTAWGLCPARHHHKRMPQGAQRIALVVLGPGHSCGVCAPHRHGPSLAEGQRRCQGTGQLGRALCEGGVSRQHGCCSLVHLQQAGRKQLMAWVAGRCMYVCGGLLRSGCRPPCSCKTFGSGSWW